MAISNYDTGFPNGITVRGIPLIDLQNSAGQVFWVDSNYYQSGNGNRGTFASPLKTLQAAIDKCRPNEGDKIFVAAGHYEEIDGSNNISVNIEGIQIIGLGSKNNRPLLKFVTDSTASFDIDAANVYIGNIRFVTNVPINPSIQPKMLAVWAKNTYFENVLFEGTSATHATLTFVQVPAVGVENNNIADFTTFVNCQFDPNTTSLTMDEAILVGAANRGLKLVNCTMNGAFDNATVYNPDISPYEFEDFEIIGGYYNNEVSGIISRALLFRSDKNGSISNETVVSTNSYFYPVIATTGRSGRNKNGDLVYVVAEVNSSSIGLTGHNLTGNIDGYFIVESISLETNLSPTTAATTIEIAKLNELFPFGDVVLLSEPIASFAAAKTIDMGNATTVNRGSLTIGAKLVIRATGAPAAGGKIRVTIGLRSTIDFSGLGRTL